LAWQKPSKKLVDFFGKVIPDLPGIEKKNMFGHPAAFINNNMFMGLNGERMTIKLSDNDREEFLKLDGAEIFECTPGKIWKQYVEIPEWMYDDISILKK
jgi:TfoX/Sxy family transcriptional regulator of competence genes